MTQNYYPSDQTNATSSTSSQAFYSMYQLKKLAALFITGNFLSLF